MQKRYRIIFILIGTLLLFSISGCATPEKNATPNQQSSQNATMPDDVPEQGNEENDPNQPEDNGNSPVSDGNAQAAADASTGNDAAPPPGTGRMTRSYTFPDTGKQIPYRVFVPSTWNAGQQFPLVVILHERGEDENSPFDQSPDAYQGIVTRLAEQYKFIVAAPLGYSRNAGYGAAQMRGPGGPGGGGSGQGGPGGQPPAGGEGSGMPQGGGPGGGAGGPQGIQQGQTPQGTPPSMQGDQEGRPGEVTEDLTDQEKANLQIYSEQDVLKVLALVTQEFNVDSTKVFLMGSGIGGNGAMHLAAKYPDRWTAIALSNGGFDVSAYETSLPALKIKGAFFIQSAAPIDPADSNGQAAGQNDSAGQGMGAQRPNMQTADQMVEKLTALGIDARIASVENTRPSEAWYAVADQIFAYFASITK